MGEVGEEVVAVPRETVPVQKKKRYLKQKQKFQHEGTVPAVV